jgi:hypothetical protein
LTSTAQLGTELIANGDLSKLDEQGWAADWPRGRSARIEKDPAGNRLVLEGAGAGVAFKIPLKPEYGLLKLSMKMKVTGVALGKESYQTGRLTMAYYNAAGERVGEWPNVFGMVGSTDWTDCERVYPVPPEAVALHLSPCNLGASGTVEFRGISLTVCRVRALVKADAPLPLGAEKDPWTLADAWRQATPTREKVCLNGLWGFRPVMKGESDERVPAVGDCWGWFKIPGVWPSGAWEFADGAQQVRLAPWLEERGGNSVFEQAWYKRRFTVPQAWGGRRIALEFTMLQTHARAFVDGVACGELWYPGGALELTGQLKPGAEQELALLVTARPLTSERNAFMAPDRIITDKASVKLKGVTGDLFLCATPAAGRLDDAQVITSVRDKTVTFAVETSGLGKGPYRLRAEVTGCGEAKRAFASGALTPDAAGALRFTAAWADAQLWDIDTPQHRYAAALTLTDAAGAALDTLTPVTFGFREIRIEGRDFVLNGAPVRLRALHNTSANGSADKATAAAARELCRRMAEYGFNALIGGNYDFTPGSVGYVDGLLEACDATGMLMAFSLPHMKDFGNKLQDPAIAERYRAQTAWLIRRARNHPSVIFYAMNHNATGYYGDQNPEKIDGVYEIPEVAATKNAWWERNRKQARLTDAIAKALDPSRPVYHHQSGNLGDLHTVNCYLNWAPVQERSDWTEHWATQGVKPLFFVEWGLPHISSWSSYRGPQFIWRCEAYQSLWAAEFAAQFWGDAAYRDDADAAKALDHEEKLWAKGKPFTWSTLNAPLRELPQNYSAVQALYASDNWRSHRAWGVSAMLPWDQGDFWTRVAETPPAEVKDALKNLKRPGLAADRLTPGKQYIDDTGSSEAYLPSAMGKALLRWNMPDCAFIGGPAEAFTSKDHLFAPGAEVRKSLVVLNDRRRAQRVKWTWRLWQVSDTHTPRKNGTGEGGTRTLNAQRSTLNAQVTDKLLEETGQAEVAAGGKAVVPVAFALPQNAKDGDTYRLTAVFEFADGGVQVDDLPLRAVKPPLPPALSEPVLLYDPRGLTAKLFERLNVPHVRFDGGREPGADEAVVIGREALDEKGLPWLAKVSGGLRVLVFEQRAAVLEGLLGFRMAERGSRALFPRFTHPATLGFDAASFRDWSGAATLLPPHLEGLPEAETHDPLWKWCGFHNTRVWRCGNRGSVASVLIEKPARGDWRALVDGEFDLQYAALLENVEGRGRVVFCQLDVTERTQSDPVADRLVVNLLGYIGRARPEAQSATVCVGSGACEELVRQLGVVTRSAGGWKANAKGRLLVAGPGAAAPDGLAQAVEQGLNAVCLGLSGEELKAWCPVPVETVKTNACFSRIEKLPPELNGLCNADWAWHGRMAFDALVVPESERETSSPALRVIRHGKGCVVLWQVPPWLIDEKAKPYLRTSKRHANAMAARLLGNLGAEFRTPLGERFALPVEQAWLKSYYLDTPEAGDDPYRYYRW